MDEIKFLRGLQASYDALQNKSSLTFYYCTDTDNLYVGEELLSNNDELNAAIQRIAANEIDIETLSGIMTILTSGAETEGSVAYAIEELRSDILDDVSADYDTLSKIEGQIESLADVARSGSAADVAVSNAGVTASTVQAAIKELHDGITELTTDSVVTLEEASTATASMFKTYNFYQGDTSTTAAKSAAFIGKIDIPKDFLVKSGKVVTVTNNLDSDNESTSGLTNGTYLKLVLNSTDGLENASKIYINVASLIDVYSGAANASEVQIAVDNYVISATVADVDASKITYIAGNSRESVKAALQRLDGDDTVNGSVSKKIKDAIDALVDDTDISQSKVWSSAKVQGLIAEEYNEVNKAYIWGDYCIYENKLFRCTYPTGGPFKAANWTEVDIADGLIGGIIRRGSGAFSYTIGGDTGKEATASAQFAQAIGENAVASGMNSYSNGKTTKATGDYSCALGINSEALNDFARAYGHTTKASGVFSHAEGSGTKAQNDYSYAYGYGTTASGTFSSAVGNQATAQGDFSQANGWNTTASGAFSHAEGAETTANHACQHVFGMYNVVDTNASNSTERGNYIEIIGNGTANNARSNARTLDWDGNEVLAGKLTVGSGPSNSMDVATKQYVDGSVTVSDVTVNGTSVVNNGTAEIPVASDQTEGVVKVSAGNGITIDQSNSRLAISRATSAQIKTGTDTLKPIVPSNQHESTFFGLAKAAGDTTQSASNNAVGTYTDEAKAAIQDMLGVSDESDITDLKANINELAENGYYLTEGEEAYILLEPGGINSMGGISTDRLYAGHAYLTAEQLSASILSYDTTKYKYCLYYEKEGNRVAYPGWVTTSPIEIDKFLSFDKVGIVLQSLTSTTMTTDELEHALSYKAQNKTGQLVTQEKLESFVPKGNKCTYPDDFESRIKPDIYYNGRFYADINIDDFRISGAGSVWVATDGNDSTGDGTEENPFLTITKARSLSAVNVHIKEGTYVQGTHYSISADLVDKNIIGHGNVILQNDDPGHYARVSGDAYIENITFKHGNATTNPAFVGNGVGKTVCFVNCTFCDAGSNGLSILGMDAVLINCKAFGNRLDGFNYHDKTVDDVTYIPNVLEIDCTAYNNGSSESGMDSCNASTAHDGSKIVRLNGEYYNCYGGIIAEIARAGEEPTISVNYGVFAHDSIGTGAYKASFWASVNTKMYLYDCKSYGGDYDISAINDSTVIAKGLTTGRDVPSINKASTATVLQYELVDKLVNDVTVNGTSIVSNGTAEIPNATTTDAGVVTIGSGLTFNASGKLVINSAGSGTVKTGTNVNEPIVPGRQHESTFYGLAKAAGDSTQSASSNAVGTYTDTAKAAIKNMLGVSGESQTITVSGTTPTITAQPNTRYICGEVLSLDFTPCSSGICNVTFTSGSTVTVLNLPNTVKMPEWFEVETNTTYEISIMDGVYGAVMSWAI